MGLRRFRVLFEQIAQRFPEKRLDHIEFSLRNRKTSKIIHDREVQRFAGSRSAGIAIDISHAAIIAPATPSGSARDWSVVIGW